jgi:hypothetical protein
MMQGKYGRFLDGEKKPRKKDILTALGSRARRRWEDLTAFLGKNYECTPELHFYGRQYGWCYKYRRKGKTLCVLFPETRAFTVLATLGTREIAQFEARASDFNDNTRMLFRSAHQYHDGKWLYKRILNNRDLRDAISLIRIKSGSST